MGESIPPTKTGTSEAIPAGAVQNRQPFNSSFAAGDFKIPHPAHFPLQTALFGQFSLLQLEMMKAYLEGARRIGDAWTRALRHQQDELIESWRKQLLEARSEELEGGIDASKTQVSAVRSRTSDAPPKARRRSNGTPRNPAVNHTETTRLGREH